MRTARIPTLADLLSPVDLDTFLADYWEKRPLHVPGPDRSFDCVLSLDDIDAVLAYTATPNVPPYSLAHDGPTLPEMDPANFMRPLGRLQKRDSLLIGAIHRRWPPIAVLCAETQAVLRHRIGATVVLSPGQERALPLHYDTPSVIAMQLYGEKEWQIWEPIEDKPLRVRPVAEVEVEGRSSQRFLMRPGDVLYVPRGLPHRCLAGDGPSLHLSMYIDPFTWRDLLSHALDDVTDSDARLRQALPAGFAASEGVPAAVDEQFRGLLAAVVEQATSGGAADRLATSFIEGMPALPGASYTNAFEAARVQSGSIVQKSPGAVCVVRSLGLQAEIQYPGGTMAAPLHLLPALQFIASAGGPFAVRDLPGLEEEAQLVLVRRLIREALLRVAAE